MCWSFLWTEVHLYFFYNNVVSIFGFIVVTCCKGSCGHSVPFLSKNLHFDYYNKLHHTIFGFVFFMPIGSNDWRLVVLSVCPFICPQTYSNLTCSFRFYLDLYKLQCSYLVCIFLESTTFQWHQHWPPCDLDLSDPDMGMMWVVCEALLCLWVHSSYRKALPAV